MRQIGKLMAGTAMLPAVGGCATLARAPGSVRPNIVLILFDDTGFSDFGCYGSEVRTPHIDALAAAGLRYNRFDTRAICSPTRAALLTGRNSHSVGMKDLAAGEGGRAEKREGVDGILASDAQMLPDALRRAGYFTLASGKWHLSPAWEDGAPPNNGAMPMQRGFDYFYGFLGGWQDQFKPNLYEGNQPIGQPDDPNYHFSGAIVDKAITQLDQRDPLKPFFLYLSLGATHSPVQVHAAYIDRYKGVYERGWDVIRQERFERQKRLGIIPPDTKLPPPDPKDRPWSSLTEDERIVYARYMATYAGFLEHADEQIGRLIAALKAEGAYENTLFVVASDNGPSSEGGATGSIDQLYPPIPANAAELVNNLDRIGKVHMAVQTPWTIASATPFRRYKSWPYLGGQRAPLVLSWGSRFAAGAIRTQAVDEIDLAPTLAEVAGARFETQIDGVTQQPVAGRSIVPTFDAANAPDPRPIQYFELRGNRAIRVGNWRAVAVHRQGDDFEKDEWKLFDLSNDFNETTDLSDRFPEKLAELKAQWMVQATQYKVLPLGEGPAYMRRFNPYGDEFSPGR